ncbi:hypothetical protein Q7P37_005838 [Cladosporium fusiforme]
MAPEKRQCALIIQGKGEARLHDDLPIPSPDPGQILIRTHAVALNPSDWMSLDLFPRAGAGMGYDFAGTVTELGSGTEHLWAIGDRVAGMVHGCSFREYLLADADLVIPISNRLSFAEASTIGMGVSTASQALYQSLSLPLPEIESKPTGRAILIYGGSTATGTLAIQLAKLSGYNVITTGSTQNMERLRSLGADKVFDYNDSDCISSIRDSIGSTGLTTILDCVAKNETAEFCYQCLVPPESTTFTSTPTKYAYASLMQVEALPPTPKSLPEGSTVEHKMNMVYTCFGRRFNLLGKTWEPSRADRQFMVDIYGRIGGLLNDGTLRLMPIEVRKGGLETVPQGIADVQSGRVRGKKLVYCTRDEDQLRGTQE